MQPFEFLAFTKNIKDSGCCQEKCNRSLGVGMKAESFRQVTRASVDRDTDF